MEKMWDEELAVPELDVETVTAGLVELCMDCRDDEIALATVLEAVAIAVHASTLGKKHSRDGSRKQSPEREVQRCVGCKCLFGPANSSKEANPMTKCWYCD